jgi:PTS system nitrogen regulatory IIA component
MMNITHYLYPESIICKNSIGSKKKLLEILSALLAVKIPNLSDQTIFDSLINREKLGSTGLGNGVAIPHGRIDRLENPVCAFIKLDEAVDFDATDDQPVDLVFALLVPENSTEEHLQVLSIIAEILSDPSFCARLRNCQDSGCLQELMLQGNEQRASA